jgi:hypothetical protein
MPTAQGTYTDASPHFFQSRGLWQKYQIFAAIGYLTWAIQIVDSHSENQPSLQSTEWAANSRLFASEGIPRVTPSPTALAIKAFSADRIFFAHKGL